jgi:hypothetical protein
VRQVVMPSQLHELGLSHELLQLLQLCLRLVDLRSHGSVHQKWWAQLEAHSLFVVWMMTVVEYEKKH